MKLSVAIANRNDHVMLALTVKNVLEELRPIGDDTEVVIADNSNQNVKDMLKAAISNVYIRTKRVRILDSGKPSMFTARDLAIKESKGEYVLCIDSHELMGRDMIKDLYDYRQTMADNAGFLYAPITFAHRHDNHANYEIRVTDEDGAWGPYRVPQPKDRAGPHIIPWKMHPWIVSRDWYVNTLKGYGALSTHRLSPGGGDMHLGFKSWMLGHENWLLPTNPAIHIGPWPKIVARQQRYRLYGNSGKHPMGLGILVAHYVWGGDEMKDIAFNIPKFTKRSAYKHMLEDPDKWWQIAKKMGQEEHEWFEKARKMTYHQLMELKPWK